jgi:hypothetical protein
MFCIWDPKKAIVFPVSKGVEFLGYRVFADYSILRKSTVKRFVKRLKKYKRKIRTGDMSPEKLPLAIQSWQAYAKSANSWHTARRFSNIVITKK